MVWILTKRMIDFLWFLLALSPQEKNMPAYAKILENK